MSIGTVMLIGKFYRIECHGNDAFKEAVKLLPDRKWKYPEKYWEVPIQHHIAVKNFAKEHNLEFHVETGIEPETDFTIPPLPELEMDIKIKRPMLPWQSSGVAYSLEKQRLISGDDMGLGKEQPLYSRILTPNGWKTMGDIKKGDFVIGLDGIKTKVSGVFPQGSKPIYRVYLSDETFTDCGLDHLWRVKDCRKKHWNVLKLSDIISERLRIKKANVAKGGYIWEVPMVQPVQYEESGELPLHPYLLGFLLGNGSFCNNAVRVSFPDQETVRNLEMVLPAGVKLVQHDEYYWGITNVDGLRRMNSNIVMKQLAILGLRGETTFDKAIPEIYMRSSIENRLALLQGLLDSDGHAKENGSAEFDNGSSVIIDQIVEIVQSLGGVANMMSVPDSRGTGDIHRVYISLPGRMNPFLLSRKASRYKTEVERRRRVKRSIVRVEYVGEFVAKCIAVEDKNHCYVTDSFIVTHNTTQAIITIEGLAQMHKASYPCLIICPSAVKENWVKEIKLNIHRTGIVLQDSVKNTFPEFFRVGMSQFFIVNYESLKKFFVDRIDELNKGQQLKLEHIHFKQKYLDFFKSVIVDESHKVKNVDALGTKLVKGLCIGKETILLLTGTPIVNKPRDLVSQLGILGRLPDFGGYKYFIKRYCTGPKEASNLKELNYKLNLICFYRRNKTDPDIKKFLPDKARQVIQCELDPIHRREYMHAQADLQSYLVNVKNQSDESATASMKGEVMVRIGILKNISARGKLKDAFAFIQDIIEQGQKIVVFASLKDVIAQVQAKFPNSVRVTGAEDGVQKQAAVDRFQNDPKINVIVLNLKAGGVGINGLQNVATQICFIEFGWHAAIMDQAEDRLYRTGQHSNVMCTYFLGKNTIDEWNYQLINSKREIANTVTGNEDQTEEKFIDSVMTLFLNNSVQN